MISKHFGYTFLQSKSALLLLLLLFVPMKEFDVRESLKPAVNTVDEHDRLHKTESDDCCIELDFTELCSVTK